MSKYLPDYMCQLETGGISVRRGIAGIVSPRGTVPQKTYVLSGSPFPTHDPVISNESNW